MGEREGKVWVLDYWAFSSVELGDSILLLQGFFSIKLLLVGTKIVQPFFFYLIRELRQRKRVEKWNFVSNSNFI